MRLLNKTFAAALLVCGIAISCKKSGSELSYGYNKIYMPQSINVSGGVSNNYPVPTGTDSSTYNYTVDETNRKVNIILGVYLSGPSKDAYSVEIGTNTDTIAQLITAGTLDASTMLLPATVYSLPTSVDVAAGAKGNTFSLSVSIDSLEEAVYAGKKLALAVKISNPSKFTLDTAQSTTIVIIDVNTLVIGPASDVTSSYIKNPGNAFVASAMNGSRWGSLAYWTANTAALSHGGVGGYCYDGDGATMDLESGWGSPLISNGKIYQTITLPAGSYAFDPSGGSWIWQGTKDAAYVVVAPGSDTLPDYADIVGNSDIQYQVIAAPQTKVSFSLTATTQVTVGVVVNYVQDQQGIKSSQVKLYAYPKHL
ncbi:MAG: DUF5013 domain-containing protein [Ilumatobacteraceae bacterium]